MNELTENITLLIKESELAIINEIIEFSTDYFNLEKTSEKKYLLTFKTIDEVLDLDEVIKEKYVSKGFDVNYNLNAFGKACEKLIDKLYIILK